MTAGGEGVHPLVDLLAEPGDLALGDAGRSHAPHEVVDSVRPDPVQSGFLDHGCRHRLGRAPGLEAGRQVGSLAQL